MPRPFVLLAFAFPLVLFAAVALRPDAPRLNAQNANFASIPSKSIIMTEGERVIRDSIDYLETLKSLTLDAAFRFDGFGRDYEGSYHYEELTILQARYDASLRPALRRTMFLVNASLDPERDPLPGDVPFDLTMEIACDVERRIWRYDSTADGEIRTEEVAEGQFEKRSDALIKEISIQDIEEETEHLDDEENAYLKESLCFPRNAAKKNCGMNGMPGLGGIAGTLRRFLYYYDFELASQYVTPDASDETRLAPENAFKRIVGQANNRLYDEIRANLGGDEIPDYIKEYLPGRVDVYFCMVRDAHGEERPFPCKLAFYSALNVDDPPYFTVEYANICRNADLPPNRFNHVSRHSNTINYGHAYMKSLTTSPWRRLEEENERDKED